MQADRPKQYLDVEGRSILEHTVSRLASYPHTRHILIAVAKDDPYFSALKLEQKYGVIRVTGGKERADSVLAGLKALPGDGDWVMVHDAARPMITHRDIDALYTECRQAGSGGILALEVKDTMKRCDGKGKIEHTVERTGLYHALTPQCYRADELTQALDTALTQGLAITDEASAIEAAGLPSLLIAGAPSNIKITRPEDLPLAAFYLQQQRETR